MLALQASATMQDSADGFLRSCAVQHVQRQKGCREQAGGACDPAAQYGGDFVPVSSEEEGYLAYKPERGIQLLGVWDADRVPSHLHLKAALHLAPPPLHLARPARCQMQCMPVGMRMKP